MIPATQPVAAETYDTWTPVLITGERVGPGAFRGSIVLRRSRVIDAETQNTELHPDPNQRVELALANIYAPVGELGEWWTAEVRDAVQAWAAAGVNAAAVLGAAQGAL